MHGRRAGLCVDVLSLSSWLFPLKNDNFKVDRDRCHTHTFPFIIQ